MMDVRSAVARLLQKGDVSVLESPQRFVGSVLDLVDPDSPEGKVLMGCCDARWLEPYARAWQARDAGSLVSAAAMGADHLRSTYVIDATVAGSLSRQVALGVADAMGVGVPEGLKGEPEASRSAAPAPPKGPRSVSSASSEDLRPVSSAPQTTPEGWSQGSATTPMLSPVSPAPPSQANPEGWTQVTATMPMRAPVSPAPPASAAQATPEGWSQVPVSAPVPAPAAPKKRGWIKIIAAIIVVALVATGVGVYVAMTRSEPAEPAKPAETAEPANTTVDDFVPDVFEKSLESTDLANIRSAYATVMAAGLSEESEEVFAQESTPEMTCTRTGSEGALVYTAVVTLRQQQDGWMSGADPEVGGVTFTGTPVAGKTATVTYSQSTETTTVTFDS